MDKICVYNNSLYPLRRIGLEGRVMFNGFVDLLYKIEVIGWMEGVNMIRRIDEMVADIREEI